MTSAAMAGPWQRANPAGLFEGPHPAHPPPWLLRPWVVTATPWCLRTWPWPGSQRGNSKKRPFLPNALITLVIPQQQRLYSGMVAWPDRRVYAREGLQHDLRRLAPTGGGGASSCARFTGPGLTRQELQLAGRPPLRLGPDSALMSGL